MAKSRRCGGWPRPHERAVVVSTWCRRWCKAKGKGVGMAALLATRKVKHKGKGEKKQALAQIDRRGVQQVELFRNELERVEGVGNFLLLGQDVARHRRHAKAHAVDVQAGDGGIQAQHLR